MNLSTYRKQNFLTVAEFAKEVRRSHFTVRHWIGARKIKSCKVGPGEYKNINGQVYCRFHENEKWRPVPRDSRKVLIPRSELDRITEEFERAEFLTI